MFDADLPEFAVHGERGIDLFIRVDDDGQRRSRFRCIATLDGATLHDHAPEDRRDGARLIALAQALAADPMALPMALADPRGWPRAADGADPIRLFVYLDFFRAWQVADLAAARAQAQLDAGNLPEDPAKLPGMVAPLLDFNRLSRGTAMAARLVAPLAARIAAPGFDDGRAGSTGYALRMLGDLCLRGGDAALALRCFEASVNTGDNPFRRRRAIEAARAAADAPALRRHRDAFRARWPLPADLAGDPA